MVEGRITGSLSQVTDTIQMADYRYQSYSNGLKQGATPVCVCVCVCVCVL